MPRRRRLVFFAIVVAAGCRHPTQGTPAPSRAGVAAPTATTENPHGSPLSQAALPTNAPDIAVGNFDGDLAGAVQLLDKAPDDAGRMARLASLYLEHARLHGRLEEYDRAEALVEKAVAVAPKSSSAWLAHAAARATLHRFDEALADLDRVAALDAMAHDEVERRRAVIWQAQGRYAEARPILEKEAKQRPRLQTLGQLALLDGDEGRIADAARGFVEAQHHFPDVSPFPVAWLWLQEGIFWQNLDLPARARELFAAAHARVPDDVTVTAHLASTMAASGDAGAAVPLVRALVASSDDPEYRAQLAGLLVDGDERRQLVHDAATGFEALVAKHPSAFADHAARFYLGIGANPKRALALATQNLGLRKTPDAYALLVDAAREAGDAARACATAQTAAAAFPDVLRVEVAAWKAYRECHDETRAQAASAAMTRLTSAAFAAVSVETR